MTKGWDDLSEIAVQREVKEGNNLLLVDGVNLAFRYLQRKNFDNYSEDYIRTINSLAKSYNAKRVICCFDSGASSYRKAIFPEYKQNRKIQRSEEEQERFTAFFNCLSTTIEELPFEHYKFKGIEADDLIAYFAVKISNKYEHTWIVSSDRDLFQLLTPKVSIFNLYSRKEITVDSLLEQYSLSPREYSYARMIEGDAGDGVPGIEGIGPKRSTALILEYGDITSLISALPIKGKAKYITNLNEGIETLKRNERLINLVDYLELAIDFSDTTINDMLTKAIERV
jgi:5'-3' exonuclease